MELRHNGQTAVLDMANGAALTDLALNAPAGRKKVISSGNEYLFSSSLLFPFPNRLANGSYTWNGKNYRFPLNDFGQPNALHGFLHDRLFEVISQSENEVSAVHRYDGALEYYPFPFIFEISYRLEESAITVTIEISNPSAQPIPFGFGWHPYFHVPQGLELLEMKLPSLMHLELDTHSLPTGNSRAYRSFLEFSALNGTTLDDSFLMQHPGQSVFLRYPDQAVLEIWQDEQFPYLQIYTPGDRNAIAVEPMTCGVNAWNADQPVPSLDKVFRGSFGVRIS